MSVIRISRRRKYNLFTNSPMIYSNDYFYVEVPLYSSDSKNGRIFQKEDAMRYKSDLDFVSNANIKMKYIYTPF